MNQLVVPAGVPLHFSLTSASVMNAFFVPQLGSMIYTMNGMATQLNLQADEPGTFHGLSATSAATASPTCISRSRAVPATSSPPGSKATRGVGPTLDAPTYAALARQSTNVPPSPTAR